MFPPEPEKPWWYHLIWALPCMAATAMLGYWLKKPGVREVEVIKEVKVTETIYRTNTIQVPVTSNAPGHCWLPALGWYSCDRLFR